MQRKIYSYLAAGLLAMVVLSITLVSFSIRPGGEHFEIYLNDKLVLQQFVSQGERVKNLALDERNVNDQVKIFYNHCGKIGTKRIVALKDGKEVLKQWQFSDVGSKKFMSFGAGDLLSFEKKNGGRKLNLVYASSEIPEGRLLASVVLNADDDKTMP
jgi:hypothetical protein